jgi:hypothetical protein
METTRYSLYSQVEIKPSPKNGLGDLTKSVKRTDNKQSFNQEKSFGECEEVLGDTEFWVLPLYTTNPKILKIWRKTQR